jgi:D-tyrosyl-tRNA(Tyr) deacylase
VDQRIQEAEKLGFDHFVSKYNKTLKNTGIKIQLVAKIEDVASMLLDKRSYRQISGSRKNTTTKHNILRSLIIYILIFIIAIQ